MRNFFFVALTAALLTTTGFGQTFEITGTAIPQGLLQMNYGSIPKGISAYDLSICNITDTKQSIVSSRIYQAVTKSDPTLEPIGKQIMLAAILRNQNRSPLSILNLVLNSTTGVLAVLPAARYRVPAGLMAGAALGALAGQQVINALKPALSPAELEKFESQVLEPALVLDSGSCVERTIFMSSSNLKPAAKSKQGVQSLSFRIH